jgi:hypothetical protein
MDEARRVLDRLSRIDELRAVRASPAVVLQEVRALLAEGEAWLAAERAGGADERAGPVAGLADGAAVVADGEAGRAAAAVGTGGEGASPVVEEAAEALARLNAALTSRAAHVRGEEVMPGERAL